MSDRISTIIPTYYRNEYLQRAIESVRAQSYGDTEIIVVDGTGESHAAPVVNCYAGVDYVAQEEDNGPHEARSAGVSVASGEYLQFLDDDDRVLDGKFEAQAEILAEDSDAGVVYGGIEHETGDLSVPNEALSGQVLRPALQFDLFPCCTSTMLIRSDVVEEIHPFDNTHGADDLGFMIELARRTEFRYLEDPVVFWGEPESRYGDSWANIVGRKQLLQKYDWLYQQYPSTVRNRAASKTYMMEGRKHLEEAQWSPQAVRSFWRGIRLSPDPSPRQFAELLAALGGRPLYRAGYRIFDSLVS